MRNELICQSAIENLQKMAETLEFDGKIGGAHVTPWGALLIQTQPHMNHIGQRTSSQRPPITSKIRAASAGHRKKKRIEMDFPQKMDRTLTGPHL